MENRLAKRRRPHIWYCERCLRCVEFKKKHLLDFEWVDVGPYYILLCTDCYNRIVKK